MPPLYAACEGGSGRSGQANGHLFPFDSPPGADRLDEDHPPTVSRRGGASRCATPRYLCVCCCSPVLFGPATFAPTGRFSRSVRLLSLQSAKLLRSAHQLTRSCSPNSKNAT